VDDFIWFLIIIAGASIFERMMRSARKKQQQQQQQGPHPTSEHGEDEHHGEGEGELERAPMSLQEMLAEQLGLNLERRPQVLPPPEPPETAAPSATATAHPSAGAVVYPRSQKEERPEQSSAEKAAEYAQRRIEAVTQRADERRRATRATQLPSHRTDLPERVSLEERAIRERGTPKTLERPRRPEDHDRFHERYQVPEPVSSHTEFHKRYFEEAATVVTRRSRLKLPDRPDWSAVKRAIVWAEVLGPPKGLS
jgi:hypothetical protein